MLDIALGKTLRGATGELHLQVETRMDGGAFVALSGPSGAGKTTILRMLAGLLAPDSGRIVLDGVTWFDAARRIHLPPQKRAIGFVFQDDALFPNLTVRANVAYSTRKDETRWVDELLDLTGLTGLQDRSPVTLSGGQKQRVALARAVARKPALLLLDEPLSALDATVRSQLQDQLVMLHQRLELTTVLVSHDIDEIFRLAQHVLRLEAGRVIRAGTPSEIFLRHLPSNKLNLQAQILAIRREEVVNVVSLLVGQVIVEVIASDTEIADLQIGDAVSVSAKAFSPYLFKARD